jgi:hypothetical protein
MNEVFISYKSEDELRVGDGGERREAFRKSDGDPERTSSGVTFCTDETISDPMLQITLKSSILGTVEDKR